MAIVSDFYHGRFLEEDELILTLIRDSIVINENQLRRLLKGKLTSSRISTRIRYMSVFGVTDQWRLRSRQEDAALPPAPWSVGIAGFLYLKHRYPDFVFHPARLLELGTKALQRYIALNELRTQMYEYQALRGWKWHGVIDSNPKLGKPLAIGKMKGPQSNILLVTERLQQSQNYMEHILSRLRNWNTVFVENNYTLPIMDFDRLPAVVLLSVSSISFAQEVASRLHVDGLKLPVWFVIDELLFTRELPQSILGLKEEKLHPIGLNWLVKRDT
nr:hypothetical protein [Brevibacillus laterosporus]